MKVLYKSILPFCLLFLLAGEALALPSSSKGKSRPAAKEQPIQITADHIDQRGNKIRAWGHVVIRYKDRLIKADKIFINTKSGKGKAEGHVLLAFKDGTRMKSRASYFNLKSKKGRMVSASGKMGKEFFLQAKEIRKLGPDHYQADQGIFTTCKGQTPDWLLQVNALDLKLGDRALFQGAIFKIKNIPVFYFPLGYVPLDTTRKSGFLIPTIGSSNINGFTIGESFYWAINQWSDATLSVKYLEKRGVQLGMEYRYAPNINTKGQISATFLEDKVTKENFWKARGNHRQKFANGAHLTGKIDITSDNNFEKTFDDNTEIRTRRSTDSFIAADKAWTNNSLDILTRLHVSTEDDTDETFALLPQLTAKTQLFRLWDSPVYFTHESSYTGFLTDTDNSIKNDDLRLNQRVDVHPQLVMPVRLAPWLTITPKIGVRGTYYSEKLQGDTIVLNDFTRELVDISVVAEGPKIQRIFSLDGDDKSLFKHIIEPRIQYDFIPDMDKKDISKIRVIDDIDQLGHTNQIKYSIIQRIFRKKNIDGQNTTEQTARFEISQTYDIIEANRSATSADPSRPFSNIRLDLDSKLTDNLLLNVETEFNVYNGKFETINLELGIRPIDSLSLFIGRRFTTKESAFLLGSLDLKLAKGWRLQFSTRYDERLDSFQENNVSVKYDNKCKCWGFAADFIQRNNINGGIREQENKFLFSLELRGIGKFDGREGQKFLHRTF